MGGKGNDSPQQNYYPEQRQDKAELDESLAMAMQMMSHQNNIFAQRMQNTQARMQNTQANMPQLPEISKAADVDWAEKQQQLQKKMQAAFNLDEARRKGRMDTILSSPLLDDEDAKTTDSLLKGES